MPFSANRVPLKVLIRKQCIDKHDNLRSSLFSDGTTYISAAVSGDAHDVTSVIAMDEFFDRRDPTCTLGRYRIAIAWRFTINAVSST
jgi:hypothetical protein